MEYTLLPPSNGDANGSSLVKPSQAGEIIQYGRIDAPPMEQEQAGVASLFEYLQLLRRHKWTIAALTLAGCLMGIVLDLSRVPKYLVRTTLEIQQSTLDLSANKTDALRESGTFETQVAIMRSRSVALGAVNRLAQRKRPVEYRPSALSTLLKDAGIAIPRITNPPSYEQLLAAVPATLKFKPVSATRIVEISCESPDPKLASDFANTVAEEYIQQSLKARWEAAERSNQWLAKQVDQLRDKLHGSEQALQSYATKSGLEFTNDKNTVVESDLALLRGELAKAMTDLASKRSRLDLAESSSGDALPAVLSDTTISGYEGQLSELRKQLAQLTATYTPEHYRVKVVQAQVTEVEKSLKAAREKTLRRVRGEYEEAERYVRRLETALTGQSALASQQAQKEIDYGILKREMEADQAVYQGTLQRVKELTLQSAVQPNVVRLIDPAAPTPSPNAAYPAQNSILGLVGGLCFAGLLVVLRERVHRAFHEPGEGAMFLGVPELGAIPAAAADGGHSNGESRNLAGLLSAIRNSQNGNESVELVSWRQKPSLMAESFRTMLASILFSGQNGNHPRVIAFTSPQPREGKSTVVSNTGIVLAEIGRRVLLIDGDLRNPRLHKIFDIPNTWGLSDILQEQQPIDQSPLEGLARETSIPNLYLLPSGPGTASISHLVFSPRAQQLLRRLRREFDMVLIDTPPILPFFEARLFGRLADAAVLVVRSGHSKCLDAQIAARRLAEDHTRLLGMVLNEWNPRSTGGAYDSYYRYQSRA